MANGLMLWLWFVAVAGFGYISQRIEGKLDELRKERAAITAASAIDGDDRFNEGVEAAAKLAEPKEPRPCDCDRCYCGNAGDEEDVAAWDTATFLASQIRKLKKVTP